MGKTYKLWLLVKDKYCLVIIEFCCKNQWYFNIMKSTHIINLGIGWAATTPLYYTLAVNNKYLHGAHYKEFHYLRTLDCIENNITDDTVLKLIKIFNSKTKRILDPTYIDTNKNRLDRYNEVLWHSEYVQHFDKKQLNYLLTTPLSIDKYIEYYQTHYNAIKDTYQATGNFSNWNDGLSSEFLKRYYKKLTDAFNIKILMIFRDPVRRLFSLSNVLNRDDPKEMIIEVVNNFDKYKESHDYTYTVNRYKDIFGADNVHYVIMEDFFSHQQEEVDKLSNFLNYEIKDIHPNVYTPDRGINAPKLQFLEDQWTSDAAKLEPEFYYYCREKLADYYNDFEDMHGSLPADWGAPINYGY